MDEPRLPGPAVSAYLYARVSSQDQKADLERQIERLTAWAAERGLCVAGVEKEVGSGLNGRRPKLLKLLSDPKSSTIVVEHRDRLGRFGTEYVEAALSACGRKVVVLDDSEVTDDLVRDMLDVLTSFCARLYGKRSAAHRAQKALAAARSEPEVSEPEGRDPEGSDR